MGEERAAEIFNRILLENDIDESTLLKICGMRLLSDLSMEYRKPHKAFEELFEFENRAMKLNSKLTHLKT